MAAKIPPLLSSYITLPARDSLVLLTGVFNANANWLLLRFLYAAFATTPRSSAPRHSSPPPTAQPGSEELGQSTSDANVKVLFVSWMREWEFWRTEARRTVGLDLAALRDSRRLAFVDGLTSLFAADDSRAAPAPANAPGQAGEYALANPTLAHLESIINSAINGLVSAQSTPTDAASRRGQGTPPAIVLILDTPSVVLHTLTPPISAASLLSAVMALRSNDAIHSTVVCVPADAPLLALDSIVSAPSSAFTSHVSFGDRSLATQSAIRRGSPSATPLETEHASLVIGLAHQSSLVLGCRMLGTGFAEDVSGVVRATRGGAYSLDRRDIPATTRASEPETTADAGEGEWLYYIGRDGSVKVWGRGGLDGE